MITLTGKKRLLKLANHLLKGKLGHKRFDFSVFNQHYKSNNLCGSRGCALGEMPIVWPKQWRFTGDGVTCVPRGCITYVNKVKWLSLSYYDYEYLFFPDNGIKKMTSLGLKESLPKYSTKKQVANNIIQFIKEYEKVKGKIK